MQFFTILVDILVDIDDILIKKSPRFDGHNCWTRVRLRFCLKNSKSPMATCGSDGHNSIRVDPTIKF